MSAYYNENDPKAAAWLRELIRCKLITEGEVDERSIADVLPADVAGFKRVHFFAGIGGWDCALQLAGWTDRPVWTGSCPCQPFSVAGKREGAADKRHLWPEFARLIAQCNPAVMFGEQVASKDGRLWLAGVRADLEALGYAVGAADLCAAGVGAPHIRQRLYWMGQSDSDGRESRIVTAAPLGQGCTTESASYICGVADAGHAEWRTWNWPCNLERRDILQRERQEGPVESGQRGEAGGMGDATISGIRTFDRQSGESARRQEPVGGSGLSCGVGDADLARSQGCGERSDEHANQRTAWSASDTIHCTDGKSRRVESGTFPLAYGIPARMGRLRGYGNAIVPQVAAEFVRACQ